MNKVDELKEVTGNRDISTGGTASGVTAASAIAAMQEAGSKLSRDGNKGSYRVFRKVCLMVIELIRQFYTLPRCFRITGGAGEESYVNFSNAAIVPVYQGMEMGLDMDAILGALLHDCIEDTDASHEDIEKIFGTTVDGVVSNQWATYQDENPGLTSGWDWDKKPNGKGSALIKAMQKWAGMPAKKRDGEFGPVTCIAFQKKLGTPADGKVSDPSQMVKALQKWANKQK